MNPENSIKKYSAWLWTAFGLYIAMVLVSILSHELWRDEIQSWMQALASHSFGDLMRNMTFERHPRLWHSSLFLLSKLTTNPLAMQLFHLLIAATSAFLILFKSPFKIGHKILIVFGYFFLYEYAAISRNYAFGILFILIYLVNYRQRFTIPILAGTILLFMAQTTAYGLLFGMCFVFLYLIEMVLDRQRPGVQHGIAVLVVLGGVYLSLQQLKSPEVGLDNVARISIDPMVALFTVDAFWKSYVPIPAFGLHYWNSNFLGVGLLRVPLAMILLLISALFFIRKPRALFFYLLGTAGVFAIMYQYHVFMYLRYSGHLFLFFIAAWWMSHYYPEATLFNWEKPGRFSQRFAGSFVTALLAVHVVGGITASVLEWFTPFSASKAAAQFINANVEKDIFILGDLDEPASAVSGHSGREIFYPRRHYKGTFIIYRNRDESIKTREVLEIARQKARQSKEDVLLVLNWQPHEEADIHKIAEFTQSVVPDEIYYIYKMNPSPF